MRLTVFVALALVGLFAGASGVLHFDGADVRRARDALGGEGLTPLFELFGAWIGAVQKAKNPLELVVPEIVEGRLKAELAKKDAARELHYLDLLDGFHASNRVSPEIRRAVEAACWSERAIHPIECHRCAEGVLDRLERDEQKRRLASEWLLGASALALVALAALGWRARRRARALTSP